MKRRIIISLALLLALYLLGSAAAIVCLDRSTSQLSSLAESHRIQAMRETLASAGLRVESDLLAHLAGNGRPDEERFDNERRLTEALNRCGGCHHQADIQAQLNGIRDTLQSYLSTANQLFAGGGKQRAFALERKALELGEGLVRQTTAASDQAGKHLTVRSAQAAESVRTARMVLIGTLGAALASGGFVAFHLKRRLTKPVEAILDGIERVRRGDLTHRFATQADEEFEALVGALNDAYQDLRAAHESILHAEKLAAVGKLAAGVAHEVLNPLASISSIAQIMRSRCDSDEQAKQVDLILSEIGRVSKVLRDLQVFSQPLAGGKRHRVDVREVIEYSATLVGYDQRAKRVAITREYDPGLRAVRGDADKLLPVCTNVMINALDALSARDDGTGVLAVTARQQGERVVVEFKDNGHGMTDEQIAQAFEPFYTTKGPDGGTGLGLWICYQVIRGYDGAIRIQSRVGAGTTVTVELPSGPEESASG